MDNKRAASSAVADGPAWVDPLHQPEEARSVLVRAVQRACPRILAAQREDLVQDALAKVISLSSGEQNRTFSRSYLWKVAFSTVADELARVQRRREDASDTAAGPVEPKEQAVAPDPFRTLKLGEAIQHCMRALRENRRVVVQLNLLGHSLAEIEQLTGQSAKRVRNLVYRGLANLRQCLVSKGFGP